MAATEGSYVAQRLTPSNIFIAFFVYLAASIVLSFVRAPRYPTNVPWVGHGKGWAAAVKNVFTGLTSGAFWMQEGYDKYSKSDRAFVMPGMLGATAETVIPQSQMPWLLEQPDSVLSSLEAHYDVLVGKYSFVSPNILTDPYHEHVIHKNLARNLNSIIPGLDEEIRYGLDIVCGRDTESWTSIDILDGFMMKMIPDFTNRMLVGLPLCRNQDFLDTMLAYTMDVIRGFLLFSLVPKLLHPVVGPIHALFPKYRSWRLRKHLVPLIRERLNAIKNKDAGNPKFKDYKVPNDYITWHIHTAMAEGRQDELEPGRIAVRVMPLNFASIHTTAITGQGALIDVLSSDPSVLASLREEAERIYSEEGNQWTKTGLARMYRMDSAIRESQRHSPISLSFLSKKVLVKEGITTPEGIHLAYGTTVGCPWSPAAADPDVYENAHIYDAFRTSREREEYEAMDVVEKGNVNTLKLKQSGLVTTSNQHIAFGHGRHACPGRFFVAHELKMLFGHLLIHYDIKPLAVKPEAKWVGRNHVPSKVPLEVRRRKI